MDDNPLDLETLDRILKEYCAVNAIDAEISVFDDAQKLLDGYRPLQYTVIFLDIYMNSITGIEAARSVRNADPDTLLVFLTSSTDHMSEAFTLHAFDYIQKPVNACQIFRVMDDILKRRTESESNRLSFYSNKRDYSLPYSEIVTVITNANYLEITDCHGNTYKTRMTFVAASTQLEQDKRFLRLLRGVLVNMDFIASFGSDTCRIKGGDELPINIRSRKSIEQTWRNYLFSKIRGDSMRRGGNQ